MALNYTRMAATAERLIEENGRSLTLVKSGEVLEVPAEPWGPDTTTDEITITVIGAIVDFENEAQDGTLIMRGDKRCLIAHDSVVDAAGSSDPTDIEKFDRLTDGGVDWKIVEVTTWQPGDTRIFYDLQLRK